MPVTAPYTSMINRIIMALIVLAPPLQVLVSGRNLYGVEYFNTINDDTVSSVTMQGQTYFSSVNLAVTTPIMTQATGAVVILSLAVIALALSERRGSAAGMPIIAGFAIYFVTNMLLCVPFGVGAYFNHSYVYPLFLLAAIFLTRDEGPDALIDTAKVCLMIEMVASLVCGITMPDLTRRVYEPEVRLPFVDFRLWGLGEHANAIAPMALTQVMLTLYRPFNLSALTALSLVSGGLIILLAQSQTTWLIGAIVVPGFLWLRRNPEVVAGLAEPSPRILAAAAGGLLLMMIAPVLTFLVAGGGSAQADDALLTGRLDVWNAAIATFRAHLLFGYGLLAWEADFRQNINVLWAIHAHNQMLQSLSVAGLVGGVGLLCYLGVLLWASIKATPHTHGLAPALLSIILVRALTEVPINMGAILIGDTVVHVLLFRLLVTPQTVAVMRSSGWALASMRR